MNSPLCQLNEIGQSVWLDFITRDFLHSGQFANLVINDCVTGVTVNPTIFEQAVLSSDLYDQDIQRLVGTYSEIEHVYHELMVADVIEAAQVLAPVFQNTQGFDGFVSMEVDPKYANDVQKTMAQARELANRAAKPNIMIKIPATVEGADAITHATAEGFNINVTLIFSPRQYQMVANAYMTGLEQRFSKGLSLNNVTSVASLFVSRIDNKIDSYIDEQIANGTEKSERLKLLRGKIGIATAKNTYLAYFNTILSDRWQALEAKGARHQRLLWASTSTKDPDYSDVKYIEPLVGANTISTMPLKTIDAFRDHGHVKQTLDEGLNQAKEEIVEAQELGINLEDVYSTLQEEGIQKFHDSYKNLLMVLEHKGKRLAA